MNTLIKVYLGCRGKISSKGGKVDYKFQNIYLPFQENYAKVAAGGWVDDTGEV